MNNAALAFDWITTLLEEKHISFKITGGLAARAHGVDRPLADIDVEVLEKDIFHIAPFVADYIVSGPESYQDESWRLMLMTLNYQGQEIDIAAAEAQIFNVLTEQWEPAISDLAIYQSKCVFNKIVPVETIEGLIAYKTKLHRPVDLEDIEQLKVIDSNTYLR